MTALSAFCSDFYVNQKLGLKLDLPERRETVLDLFDRIRKAFPRLTQFQRLEGEVALESESGERDWQWVSLRQTSIRSGHVNPATLDSAYQFHQLLLEVAPYFLSISPLDVDLLEVVFGFDFETEHDKDAIVFDALLANTPLASLLDAGFERVLDAQPSLSIELGERGDLHAAFEVRTRARSPGAGDRGTDPLSVFVTVRKYGPLGSLDDLKPAFGTIVGYAERLAEERAIPHLVVPIRNALQARG